MSHDSHYTQDDLREALDNCSRDPVHIPETIQNYGALIACTSDLTKTLRVSANAKAVLDIDAQELLGTSPAALLTQDEMHDIRNRLGHVSIEAQRELVGSRAFGRRDVQISVHKAGDEAVLEFIPETRSAEERLHLFEQARAFLTMPMEADDLDSFLQAVIARMRAMNRYDRVKLYRFMPDESGEVVAEDRAPYMPSFLGLRFPAFDIPRVARELYIKTPFRVLHDIHAEDVPLQSVNAKSPLNMSLAALRGLDEEHRQYLKNMNVRGTFSVSLVVDGKLWGLIASHNIEAKPVDPTLLMAAELSGKLISLRIQHAMEVSRQTSRGHAKDVANKVFAVDDSSLAIETYWDSAKQDLKQLVSCDGVALMVGQRINLFGDTPADTALHALFALVDERVDRPFTADDLQTCLPGAAWGDTGGAMAFAVGEGRAVKLAFLRNLAQSQLSWAGAPTKDVIKDESGIRLDPRNSFETYVQQVQGRATEWTASDIEIGSAVMAAFREAFAVQQELSGNRHRLGLMVRELNHRVRNILALVQSISAHTRENATSFAAYTESLEQRIVALAGAHNLLTRADMEGASLKDVVAFELTPYSDGGSRVHADGPDVAFRPEAVSVLALLIHELTSNAAKHGALSTNAGRVDVTWSLGADGVTIDWAEMDGPPVRPPERTGFGRSIIEDAIPYEFKGDAEIRFDRAGVRARFRLPSHTLADKFAFASDPSEPEGSPAPEQALTGLKGLVVEDNFIVSKIAAQMLMREGFAQVDRAATVSEALAFLEDRNYDACLLDVNLRSEVSHTVATALQKRGIPFIFATGYGSDQHAATDNFDAPKLTKPVEPEKLRQALARLALGQSHG